MTRISSQPAGSSGKSLRRELLASRARARSHAAFETRKAGEFGAVDGQGSGAAQEVGRRTRPRGQDPLEGTASRADAHSSARPPDWSPAPTHGALKGTQGLSLLLLGILLVDHIASVTAAPAVLGASFGAARRGPLASNSTAVVRDAQPLVFGRRARAEAPRPREVTEGARAERHLTSAARAVTSTIHLDKPYAEIGPSFLGLSQEWPWIGTLIGSPDLIRMVKDLTAYDTGPMILRIGGASADTQTKVPTDSVWEGLARFHRETGAKFILGLNLASGDMALTKAQFKAARDNLPTSALLSFELGNEPNYYYQEGYRNQSNWLNGYPAQFRQFGETLANTTSPRVYGQFSGPAWGHIFMEPEKMSWILSSTHHLLNRATVHFYKATRESGDTAETLLDEAALQQAMRSLRKQAQVTQRFGVPLLVGESNSISNGGLPGVSDSFSAALWAVDTTFEIAHNGAVGVNYHQASNYRFFDLVQDPASNQTLVYPHPNYLGYLLFQQAVRGRGALVGKEISGADRVKIWPLVQGKDVRVVVINKDPAAADIHLTFSDGTLKDGRLTRLLAPSLAAQRGATLAGQSYDRPGARPVGPYVAEAVPVEHAGPSQSGFSVHVPAFSAALLEAERRG